MNPDRRRWILHGGIAGLATLVLMLTTQPFLAICWDEAYTLGREARMRLWFQALKDPSEFAKNWVPPSQELVQQLGQAAPRPDQVDSRWELLFDPKVVDWFWPFATYEPHGHPPFYAWLGLIGDVLVPWCSDLTRARLGPILLFSLTAGILFGSLGSRWGTLAASTALGAWVLQPRLFAEGHLATYDGVLTSIWMLAALAFARSEEAVFSKGATRLWRWTFGILLGCAAATKLTGWFLPIPFAAWILWSQSRKGAKNLLIGLAIAAVVVFLLTPPWWSEPIAGLMRFFRSNLSRGSTTRIPIEFLRTVYITPNDSLPWYNTLVWTLFAVPVGFLILALLGAFNTAFRRPRDPLAFLFLTNWLFVLALRAAPHTPGHDGVRLFLPAFGFLAGLASYGAKCCDESRRPWTRWIPRISILEGAIGLAVIMPVPLSYYSPIVGGLPGATALGMEPTYYWDALDSAAKAWLRENTPEGSTIQFASSDNNWLYLRRQGDLPPRLAGMDPGARRWYVLQNRPGALSLRSADQAIIREVKPAYTVTKLGVPLVWIFPWAEAEKRLIAHTP